MSGHNNSPPITTPLEPCRVAPYVNMPSIRGSSTAVTNNIPNNFPTPVTFSAFDPALISAAHQVTYDIFNEYIKHIKCLFNSIVCGSSN